MPPFCNVSIVRPYAFVTVRSSFFAFLMVGIATAFVDVRLLQGLNCAFLMVGIATAFVDVRLPVSFQRLYLSVVRSSWWASLA